MEEIALSKARESMPGHFQNLNVAQGDAQEVVFEESCPAVDENDGSQVISIEAIVDLPPAASHVTPKQSRVF